MKDDFFRHSDRLRFAVVLSSSLKRKPLCEALLGPICVGFIPLLASLAATLDRIDRWKETKVYVHRLERFRICSASDM